MGLCQLEQDSLSFGSVAAVVELSQGGEGSVPNLLHTAKSTTVVTSLKIWPSADGLMTVGLKNVCGGGALDWILRSFEPRIQQARIFHKIRSSCQTLFQSCGTMVGGRLVFLY